MNQSYRSGNKTARSPNKREIVVRKKVMVDESGFEIKKDSRQVVEVKRVKLSLSRLQTTNHLSLAKM